MSTIQNTPYLALHEVLDHRRHQGGEHVLVGVLGLHDPSNINQSEADNCQVGIIDKLEAFTLAKSQSEEKNNQ